MKKLSVPVCLTIMSIILLPYFALAQGTDPPDCCKVTPHFIAPVEPKATTGSTSQLSISGYDLKALGLSISGFVDRLAGSLFPGKSIDLIISVSRPIPNSVATLGPSADGRQSVGSGEGILLGAEENLVYQIPRARLRASDIDDLDRFSITDGQVTIEITFTKVDPAGTTL